MTPTLVQAAVMWPDKVRTLSLFIALGCRTAERNTPLPTSPELGVALCAQDHHEARLQGC